MTFIERGPVELGDPLPLREIRDQMLVSVSWLAGLCSVPANQKRFGQNHAPSSCSGSH